MILKAEKSCWETSNGKKAESYLTSICLVMDDCCFCNKKRVFFLMTVIHADILLNFIWWQKKSSKKHLKKRISMSLDVIFKTFLLPYHEHIKFVNGADIEWRLNAGWNLHTHKKDHKSSATSRYHKLSAPMPFINRFSLQY